MTIVLIENKVTETPTPAQRRRNCLLGGGVGDALGAPVEFWDLARIHRELGPEGVTDLLPSPYGRPGLVTDDTQMTCFTTEGLIRAEVRGLTKGICDVSGVVWYAYQRWLFTQDPSHDLPEFVASGWLLTQTVLHARRAPGKTCLAALRGDRPVAMANPTNHSKGCGGVMRMAPAGLLPGDQFLLGCELAALTHGHPSGYLSAGAFALILGELFRGQGLRHAIDSAVDRLEAEPGSQEVIKALRQAVAAADNLPAEAQTVETLGQGWVAEEALAIAVFCALKAEDFESGVLLAVNHSGDSDSTGAMAGNLLGVMASEDLPARWFGALDLQCILIQLADDLGRVQERASDFGQPSGFEVTPEFWEKYPGC